MIACTVMLRAAGVEVVQVWDVRVLQEQWARA